MLNEQHEERVECDMVHPQASMLKRKFKKKIDVLYKVPLSSDVMVFGQKAICDFK